MYDFKKIPDDDVMLDSSPLVRMLEFLHTELQKKPKGIALTKSTAFQRRIVAEAISKIQWPDWTEQEIYHGIMPIKVADEHHFRPLLIVHDLLLHIRVVRNYKSRLLLTRKGTATFASRFNSFDIVAQELLCRAPYFDVSHQRDGLLGSWDIWLNVLDVEADTGVSGQKITETFYGPAPVNMAYDLRTSTLYDRVLMPLVWCGLLTENMDIGRILSERVYTKTALWGSYLKLDPKQPKLRIVH